MYGYPHAVTTVTYNQEVPNSLMPKCKPGPHTNNNNTNIIIHHFSLFYQYNPVFDVAISADEGGQLQYWGGPKQDYKMPKCVRYESAMDTDLYTYVVVSAKKLSQAFMCALNLKGNLYNALPSCFC